MISLSDVCSGLTVRAIPSTDPSINSRTEVSQIESNSCRARLHPSLNGSMLQMNSISALYMLPMPEITDWFMSKEAIDFLLFLI